MILKPLSRNTLTQQAVDTIRRFILSASLKAGDPLPSERELSTSLSVSRNIVREALSALVAEGLVEKRVGLGIFVREYDPGKIVQQLAVTVEHDGHNVDELREARAAVELGSAHLMAERITEEQIAQLAEINDILADNLTKGHSAIKEDIDFHKVLLQSTHNSVLTGFSPLLVEHFRLSVMHEPIRIILKPKRIVGEHRQIISALRTRDAQAVRAALLAHPL